MHGLDDTFRPHGWNHYQSPKQLPDSRPGYYLLAGSSKRHGNDEGLPKTGAALVEPSPADERRLQLFKNSDGKITRITNEGCAKNEGELLSFRLPAKRLAKIALEIG